jgi:peroxiredoxin
MRKVVLIIGIALLFGFTNDEQKPFTISGILKNSPAKVVYLEETNIVTGIKTLKDSSAINTDGKFSITTKAAEEGVYALRLQNDIPPFVTFINDASNISLDADFNKKFDFYNISGSKSSQGIQEFFSKISGLHREKINNYYQIDSLKKNNGPGPLIQNLSARQKEINKEIKTYVQQIVQNSDKVPFSLFILANYQNMASDPNYNIDGFTGEEMLGFLDAMIKKFPDHKELVGIRSTIESQIPKSMWVGKQAPEISLPDTEGKVIKLSSFRGKYVLVDFWASWCGPCRRENPNVVEAYNKFKESNFTILGVSLDQNMEAWKKAIIADNLSWTHISDLKYWQSEVVPLYGITGIPFNVLVDPSGKVIAENLRGAGLQEKLSEILEGKTITRSDNTIKYIIAISAVVIILLLVYFLVYNKKKKAPVRRPPVKNQHRKKK